MRTSAAPACGRSRSPSTGSTASGRPARDLRLGRDRPRRHRGRARRHDRSAQPRPVAGVGRRDPAELWSPPRSTPRTSRPRPPRSCPLRDRGSFWREHRALPRRPIRPGRSGTSRWPGNSATGPSQFWVDDRPAISATPPCCGDGPRHPPHRPPRPVVLAGLTGLSWKTLPILYRAGARGLFDAVSLHPYTTRPRTWSGSSPSCAGSCGARRRAARRSRSPRSATRPSTRSLRQVAAQAGARAAAGVDAPHARAPGRRATPPRHPLGVLAQLDLERHVPAVRVRLLRAQPLRRGAEQQDHAQAGAAGLPGGRARRAAASSRAGGSGAVKSGARSADAAPNRGPDAPGLVQGAASHDLRPDAPGHPARPRPLLARGLARPRPSHGRSKCAILLASTTLGGVP